MNKTKRSPLAGALALAFSTTLMSLASPLWAQENGVTEPDNTDGSPGQNAAGIELGKVSVTGSRESGNTEDTTAYTSGSASTSTRMNLSLRETPQSVSVMTRTQMDDFNLNDINEVLDSTPGVKVERVETDRFYYTSRGFDITNFQIDGVGIRLPDGNVSGGIDTAIYDRVEVVRGANGLMAGAGNPSATVNLIRKRPKAQPRATVKQTLGSWDAERLDADVSGALTDDGAVRGRLVFAKENTDYYLDRYAKDKTVLYTVVEADLSDHTLLTLGRTQQSDNADSPMWGALPLTYSDGTRVDYDVSASSSPDWSYWDSRDVNTFAELSHQLANGWETTAIVSQTKHSEEADISFMIGSWDRQSGTGLGTYGSRYDEDQEILTGDVYASGPFKLAGREHEAMVGASWAEGDIENFSYAVTEMLPVVQDLSAFMDSYKQPDLEATVRGAADYEDKQTSIYGGSRFSVTDRLSTVVGARLTNWESEGTSYTVSKTTEHDDVVTPYTGLMYDFSERFSIYASYTEIFNQQTETDINDERIGPLEGVATEAGIKGSFAEGRVNTTLAAFEIEQTNRAVATGNTSASGAPASRGADGITSEGFEVEVAGEVLTGLQLSAAYTYQDLESDDLADEVVEEYTPKALVKISSVYRLPQMPDLKVGASLNWQDDTQRDFGGGVVVEQPAYTVLNLMSRYDMGEHFTAAVNVNNVTDEKYLTSLYWGQSYYAAPRNVSASLTWRY